MSASQQHDDLSLAMENGAKEHWYDVRDGFGRGDTLAHKIRTFAARWGHIETVCGRPAYVIWVETNTTDRRGLATSPPSRFFGRPPLLRCRRCEAEIASGRFRYP